MKKYIVPVISVICIAAVILIACSAQNTPAQPVDAPASVSESTSEPEPESAAESVPDPEPEPEPEFHCDFDAAVEAFLSDTQDHADIHLEDDPIPLYEYLFSEEITSAYVKGQDCKHPYSEGYLYWCQTGRVYDPENPSEEETSHERPYEEIRRDYEESMRRFQERERQQLEEDARLTEELIEANKNMDYDHSATFDF